MLSKELKNFLQIENVEITYGPDHPDSPREELRDIFSDLLDRNSFLKDQGYIEFLKVVGGACVDLGLGLEDPDYYFAGLYELDGILSDSDSEEITEDGFFVIGEFCYHDPRGEKSDLLTNVYAFDATGERQQGVYKCIYAGDNKYKQYKLKYKNFNEFLSAIVEKNGILK